MHTFPTFLQRIASFTSRRRRREIRQVTTWRREGYPVPPPPVVKHRTICEYAERFGLSILIETGTLYGDTLAACSRYFRRMYSIELSEELYKRAVRRFANDPRVTLLHGDSKIALPEILAEIDQPVLFWLDGHYSGGETARGISDTPVRKELEVIIKHPVRNHVILIDDAREFTGGNYPSLDELRDLVHRRSSHCDFLVRDDIIRICFPNRLQAGGRKPRWAS